MLTLWSRLPRRIDREWFAREQVDLVAFANEPWARRYLTIDQDAPEYAHLPIVGLWGNAVHYQLTQRERVAVFYSRDVFAWRLHGFSQQVRRGGEFAARVRLATPAKESLTWAVAATGTFNPDANPETTSVDGTVRRGGVNETFATIRGGAGTQALDTNATSYMGQIQATTTSNQYEQIDRYICLFDSSSLTSGAMLSSAVLSTYVTTKGDGLGAGLSLGVVTSTPASNTGLVTADYGQLGTTRQASDKAISSLSTSAYADFSLNSTGLGNVSLTGISKFGLRLDADIDNSAPSWVSGGGASVFGNHADNGSNKPKLVVTYSVGGAAALLMLMNP